MQEDPFVLQQGLAGSHRGAKNARDCASGNNVKKETARGGEGVEKSCAVNYTRKQTRFSGDSRSFITPRHQFAEILFELIPYEIHFPANKFIPRLLFFAAGIIILEQVEYLPNEYSSGGIFHFSRILLPKIPPMFIDSESILRTFVNIYFTGRSIMKMSFC